MCRKQDRGLPPVLGTPRHPGERLRKRRQRVDFSNIFLRPSKHLWTPGPESSFRPRPLGGMFLEKPSTDAVRTEQRNYYRWAVCTQTYQLNTRVAWKHRRVVVVDRRVPGHGKNPLFALEQTRDLLPIESYAT